MLDQVSKNGRVMGIGLSVPKLSRPISSRAEQNFPVGMVIDGPY